MSSRQHRTAGSGDTDVLQLLETIEAREELAKKLEAAFDQELLDEAMRRGGRLTQALAGTPQPPHAAAALVETLLLAVSWSSSNRTPRL